MDEKKYEPLRSGEGGGFRTQWFDQSNTPIFWGVLLYPFCTLFQDDEGRLQDSEDHSVETGHDHHDPNEEDEDHHDVDTDPHGVEEDHDPHDIEPDTAGRKENEDEIKGKFND